VSRAKKGLSPRGRIDAMRAVEREGAPIDERFVEFMSTCVQCRGCEPACPSGVPYGRLIDAARTAIAPRSLPWWQRVGLRTLGWHRVLLAGSTLLAVAQRARLVPHRLGLTTLPLRRPRELEATGSDVWIFTGCVMDAWQRHTHHSTAALVTAAGATFAVPDGRGACCGALAHHAGWHDEAHRRAERTMASMSGEAPILVDSAGCGAALKEYGSLLGTDEAARFSARVLDIHEWLAPRMRDIVAAAGVEPLRRRVIVQDPCHLRHVQRCHQAVRDVLGAVADMVELDDDGLCCGAGGAYSVTEPELATAIRARKLDAIERARLRSGATVVASANPGCSMHLAAATGEGIDVVHPVDIVVAALGMAPTR
jgi:glycolate oxidase iron-sulfur subunit